MNAIREGTDMNGSNDSRVNVSPHKRRHRLAAAAGFTLIELMIVCAIIAILATLAYPSYIKYITRTHRVAAEGCLSEYANYMERFYTTNLNYVMAPSALPTLDCNTQTDENYSYALASVSSTAYVVAATPVNAQLSRDTKCGTLSISQTGTRTKGGTGTLDECW